MSETCSSIVVIEDEPQIRRFVCDALHHGGYPTTGIGTAAAGLSAAAAGNVQLIILDLGLPDMSGLEFIRQLRSWSMLPILVLSARADERDKIAALDAGADDYLTKPFSVGELLARVRVLLRRHPLTSDGSSQFTFGNVCVDLARHVVTRDEGEIHLTQLEFRLLAALLVNAGKVMTNRHLMREVWGSHNADQEHYVRIYMRRLRQKLEHDPTRPRFLLTETGVGYRFQP